MRKTEDLGVAISGKRGFFASDLHISTHRSKTEVEIDSGLDIPRVSGILPTVRSKVVNLMGIEDTTTRATRSLRGSRPTLPTIERRFVARLLAG